MSRNRTTVQDLANEADLETDDALITLWEGGLDYVNGPADHVRRREINRARRILGLATRRELSSREYWRERFAVDELEFNVILEQLGVPPDFNNSRLSRKAINRLRGEARKRGIAPATSARDERRATTPRAQPPLRWTIIGHERELRYLSATEVRNIHEILAEDFRNSNDPIDPVGVRSESLLESAVFRPHTALGTVLKYPTVEMAAAALLHALVHDHPFHNGNKRTGLVSMLVFLDENHVITTCEEDDLFKVVVRLAQHALVDGGRRELADREALHLANWIRTNSRLLEKGDRPIPWRRLRKLLSQHDCGFDLSSGVGNRINIIRDVRKTGLFRRSKTVTLKTQVFYADEGRDIEKNTIAKIRTDLELDDKNGIDSAAFYDNAPASASEFIVRYRKTLNRLARL